MKIEQTFALGCLLVIDTLWEGLGLEEYLEDIERVAGGREQLARAVVSYQEGSHDASGHKKF